MLAAQLSSTKLSRFWDQLKVPKYRVDDGVKFAVAVATRTPSVGAGRHRGSQRAAHAADAVLSAMDFVGGHPCVRNHL